MTARRFEPRQNWAAYKVAYTMKDKGKTWYRHKSKGFDGNEGEQRRVASNSISTPKLVDCPMETSETTLWIFAVQMKTEDLRSLRPYILLLVTCLAQRGKHVPYHT